MSAGKEQDAGVSKGGYEYCLYIFDYFLWSILKINLIYSTNICWAPSTGPFHTPQFLSQDVIDYCEQII